MKKCPFCNAEIEENARFCLYCMTPFEEKKVYASEKKENVLLPAIITALSALLFLLVVVLIFSSFGNKGDDSSTPPYSENTTTESATAGTTESSLPTSVASDVYDYRDAVPTDDFNANIDITENCVVITSVKAVDSDGIYEIPETIDNKKVIAIMDYAFCKPDISDTVKQIIIPSSVKTINHCAFYKCYNLTDIYIKGEAVACPSVILPEKDKRNYPLTIHCSATCHDRNLRTYKTLCTYFDAEYEEWNQ